MGEVGPVGQVGVVGDAGLDQGGDFARHGVGFLVVQVIARNAVGGGRLILERGRLTFARWPVGVVVTPAFEL